MRLVVDRKWKKDTYTIGVLYIDGIRFCETLEDKDRGLMQTMSLDEIKRRKIYGVTAIPKGIYEVGFTYSSKFANKSWAKPYGGKVISIKNVPGYSGIRVHPMTTAEDSLGCVGVGRNTIVGKITNSQYWYKRLVDLYILPSIKKGEKITIEIK